VRSHPARRAAALLACLWMLGGAGSAHADAPSGDVIVQEPSGPVEPGTVRFAGSYLGEATAVAQHAVYAVDVSGSTQSGYDDCNGDGAVDTADDLNGDLAPGTTLDCEIAGVTALNASLRARASGLPVGLIAFADSAARADMSPDAANQPETSAIADADGDRVPDVETVAASLTGGVVSRFTSFSVGGGTDFSAPLQQFGAALAEAAPPAGVKAQYTLFFLSDGIASYPAAQIAALKAAASANPDLLPPVVNTVSVGSGAAGCGDGSPLKAIADAFGGTCTAAAPSQLQAVLGDALPQGLDHIEVTFNGTTQRASVDALGGWTADFPGVGASAGGLPYTVTAVRTDGSTSVRTGVVQVRRSGFRYVALGDSYSSGNGLVPYRKQDRDPAGFGCQRSDWASAFSVRLPNAATLLADDASATVDLRACGGAQTKDVVAVSQVNGQHPQIEYLDDRADLVTLTIGGNDVFFSDVMVFCGEKNAAADIASGAGVPGTDTAGCQDRAYKRLNSGRTLTLDEFAKLRLALLQADELDALRQVRAAAPNATVMVADYPHLIAQDAPGRCQEEAAFTSGERRWIRTMGDRLDDLVAHVARQAGVFGVSVLDRFADHEKCGGGTDWMYGFEGSGKERHDDDESCSLIKKDLGPFTFNQTFCKYGRSFHPKREGTAAYGAAYSDELASLAAAPPNGLTRSGLPRNPEPEVTRSSSRAFAREGRALRDELSPSEIAEVEGLTTGSASVVDLPRVQGLDVPAACGDDLRALPGQLLAVDGDGFAPGAAVTPVVSVAGGEVSFDPVTAGADGAAGARILLPAELRGATVTVRLSGTGPNGFEHRATSLLFNAEGDAPCVDAQRAAGLLSPDGSRLPAAADGGAWSGALRVPAEVADPSPSPSGGAGAPVAATGGASAPKPAARRCKSRRSLTITLPRPRGGSYRQVTVEIRSGGKRVVRSVKPRRAGKALRTVVSLKGLPVGTYRVTIRLTTHAGKRRVVKRTYKTCAPARR